MCFLYCNRQVHRDFLITLYHHHYFGFWNSCNNKLGFIVPQRKKSGEERSGDLGGQMVLEIILSANTSSKSAIDMCAVWAVAPSCWKQALSISSSLNCAMKGYTILSQYRWGLRVCGKKNGSDYAPTRHSNPACFCTVIVRCRETFWSPCIYLRTNSDLCHLQHKLIGFYNRDEKCLQRGTDWVFK